jgi:hypothetical protein
MHLQREDLLERGLDASQVRRLMFVRWSLHAGYAQFHEWITSDAPATQTPERDIPPAASGREEVPGP